MWTAVPLFWLFDSNETAIHNFLEKPLNFFKIVSDLSKAYDVLNLKIMVSELDAYGIRGIVNLWLKSHLWNCKQPVKINYDDSTKITRRYLTDLNKIKHVCLKVQSLAQFFIFIIYKWCSNKYKGAQTVLLADDINILIKTKHENILNQKEREL